jgi:hypothetical protein
MKIKETISNYYNKPHDKEREIGKFHASEIWSIFKGYTTAGNFFKQKDVDKRGMACMFRGSAMEDMLCRILTEEKVDFKTQERFELKEKDWVISGKLDFNFPDYVLETKCPDSLTNGIPDKWKFQLCCYAKMTGKPVFLGIFDKQGDDIIRFFKYEYKEEDWDLIKTTLDNFHNKLIKKYKK